MAISTAAARPTKSKPFACASLSPNPCVDQRAIVCHRARKLPIAPGGTLGGPPCLAVTRLLQLVTAGLAACKPAPHRSADVRLHARRELELHRDLVLGAHQAAGSFGGVIPWSVIRTRSWAVIRTPPGGPEASWTRIRIARSCPATVSRQTRRAQGTRRCRPPPRSGPSRRGSSESSKSAAPCPLAIDQPVVGGQLVDRMESVKASTARERARAWSESSGVPLGTESFAPSEVASRLPPVKSGAAGQRHPGPGKKASVAVSLITCLRRHHGTRPQAA